MGQLKSASCPVCLGINNGRWTCPDCTALVNTHRELIRNLQAWKSLLEGLEVEDTIVSSDGRSHTIWDVEYFYAQRKRLPQQMQRAIELFLFENHKESEAAVRMGLTDTSPIGIYATVGLTKLLAMARAGEFPGYRLKPDGGVVVA